MQYDIVLAPTVSDPILAVMRPAGGEGTDDRTVVSVLPGISIEFALTCPLPSPGATVTTPVAQLETLAFIAVLQMRAAETLTPAIEGRIRQLGPVARLVAHIGPVWRPHQELDLVTIEQALVVFVRYDLGTPIATRVAAIRSFLETGDISWYPKAAARVREIRVEAAELENKVRVLHDGRVAVIEAPSALAVEVAGRDAPIVVHVNPGDQGGGHGRRVLTVVNVSAGAVNLEGIMEILDREEPGWWGDDRAITSPPGRDSDLSPDWIADIVSSWMPGGANVVTAE